MCGTPTLTSKTSDLQGVCEKVVIFILNFGNKKIFKY